jgi:hypothetical protein
MNFLSTFKLIDTSEDFLFDRDRIDSAIFSAPAMYMALELVKRLS